MEQTTADLGDIAEYFEYQIALGDSFGLPGLGSFVANSSTEIAPQDTDVATKVSQHNARLENGFKVALQNSVPSTSSMTSKDVTQLAGVIVIFANGLWSLSRNTTDAAILRDVVASFLKMVREHPK